jgi:hypothetical protein
MKDTCYTELKHVTWVSAHLIAEQQTRQMARDFKTSRPAPRNRAMGFRGIDRAKSNAVYLIS